jgi:aspartyl-tRNA(Asn)/glutamyl-tRNA(Gln) amidotransferase subunit C
VAHIARLSRLALSEAEARAMGEHMDKILAWVAELNELDTEEVSPTLHDAAVDGMRNRLAPAFCCSLPRARARARAKTSLDLAAGT